MTGLKANRASRFVATHTSAEQGRVHLTVQATLSRQIMLGYHAVDLQGMTLEVHLMVE